MCANKWFIQFFFYSSWWFVCDLDYYGRDLNFHLPCSRPNTHTYTQTYMHTRSLLINNIKYYKIKIRLNKILICMCRDFEK